MSPVSWGDIFTLPLRGDRIMELRQEENPTLVGSWLLRYHVLSGRPVADHSSDANPSEASHGHRLLHTQIPSSVPSHVLVLISMQLPSASRFSSRNVSPCKARFS